ncbi:MAG TPA: type II CAAX endopeptidase family protein [Ohtaekwangia sp.]|uniref:CPBP family intramembrane glutamic endopeptidase n=1 Tax=Ohtaekwangia sp. TaxID=2066019 RepID=UPI002F951E6E
MELKTQARQTHPAVVILITLVAVLMGFQVVGPMIGFFVALPFYPGTLLEMTEALKDPTSDPNMKVPLYLMQGFGTLFGLILVPMFLLTRFHESLTDLFRKAIPVQAALLIGLIVMVFMITNSFFIEWNKDIHLPSGIEEWAKSTEEQLGELTEYLTSFDSQAQVFLALIVIAVLPAIGEELVFRGIIQREFFRASNNIHLAIWTSAAIFSAIHLQFYGFVPRMLLGALFGYVYYWSGNLWIPVLAHFINNGFTVIAMYLYQQGSVKMDIESSEAAPWPAVAGCGVATVLLLYIFKKMYEKHKATELLNNTNEDHTTLVP